MMGGDVQRAPDATTLFDLRDIISELKTPLDGFPHCSAGIELVHFLGLVYRVDNILTGQPRHSDVVSFTRDLKAAMSMTAETLTLLGAKFASDLAKWQASELVKQVEGKAQQLLQDVFLLAHVLSVGVH